MLEYEKIYNDVKNILSEKRFKHTQGVVERAIEYAEIYGEDIENVKLAAITHDIAKEISKEESYKLIEKYGMKLDDIEKKNSQTVHSKLGAVIVKEKYNFSDEIINAIKYHTTGKENMTMLEKIIYLADATEPNREYFKNINDMSLNELVELIKKDIDKGLEYVLKWTLESLLRRNLHIHLDTVKAYNFYHNS